MLLHKMEPTIPKKYVKQILVIDDLVNRNHFCDILIDPTYDRKPIDYQSLTKKIVADIFSGSRLCYN